jgi:hypothetical protein
MYEPTRGRLETPCEGRSEATPRAKLGRELSRAEDVWRRPASHVASRCVAASFAGPSSENLMSGRDSYAS